MPDLMPGAEPFFFQGGRVGVLLVHGFTGSPQEMRTLGEALAAEGHTVLAVRLPHHATLPGDMARAHWRDWYAAALDGYFVLRGLCQSVFVMGLSMGGAIVLKMSAHYAVAGVVALSTPGLLFARKMDWRINFADVIAYVRPYIQKRAAQPTDPEMHAKRVAYSVYPVRAVPQFRQMLREADAVLPQVKVPVLLAHSRSDRLIPAENMPHIFARLGSAEKDMLWLERSDHVITEEIEREQVFARVNAFVRAHAPHAEAA
jgi:carboxylesterase